MQAPKFLQTAKDAIDNRATSRDLPEGERSMGRAVHAYQALRGTNMETEEDGWLFQVILKAARATAGSYNADDYVDMAAYAALTGEAAAYDKELRDELNAEPRSSGMIPGDDLVEANAFVGPYSDVPDPPPFVPDGDDGALLNEVVFPPEEGWQTHDGREPFIIDTADVEVVRRDGRLMHDRMRDARRRCKWDHAYDENAQSANDVIGYRVLNETPKFIEDEHGNTLLNPNRFPVRDGWSNNFGQDNVMPFTLGGHDWVEYVRRDGAIGKALAVEVVWGISGRDYDVIGFRKAYSAKSFY